MKTLNTQALLAEAIRRLEATDAPDELLEGLVELKATLPERMQAKVSVPQPPHLATNPNPSLESAVESWIKRNGNPRLEPELRELADAIGDVEL